MQSSMGNVFLKPWSSKIESLMTGNYQEYVFFSDEEKQPLVFVQGKILGVESAYGAVCRSFSKLAFQDEDSEHSLTLQERDMIEVKEQSFEIYVVRTQ